jgi:hypothetical protein
MGWSFTCGANGSVILIGEPLCNLTGHIIPVFVHPSLSVPTGTANPHYSCRITRDSQWHTPEWGHEQHPNWRSQRPVI